METQSDLPDFYLYILFTLFVLFWEFDYFYSLYRYNILYTTQLYGLYNYVGRYISTKYLSIGVYTPIDKYLVDIYLPT